MAMLLLLCSLLLQASAFTWQSALKSSVIDRTHLEAAVTSSPALEKKKERLLAVFSGRNLTDNVYACPESLQPLELVTRFYGLVRDAYFFDSRFGAKYRVSNSYVDFTKKANEGSLFDGQYRIGQRFFQNPIVSAFYERGYRQNFENFGFPGIDKEFEEASIFFRSANMTDTVLDLSCGSGFMTRKFVKSEEFGRVIAADLSPSMLAETKRRCLSEQVKVPELIRCDSAKLPFQSGSLSAVHAGAAMHCWPEVSLSLAEIYRVLKPGGVYYATTFLNNVTGSQVLSGQANRQGFTFFTSTDQISDLLRDAGFSGDSGDCDVRREGSQCIVIRAMKAPVNLEALNSTNNIV